MSEQRYLPFGQVRTDVSSPNAQETYTDMGFTGQRDNSYIKLMDYHSRWYDPQLGRFSQPDTIIPNLYKPQSLNRYSYTLNNPIRYNDPTGHYCEGVPQQYYNDCLAKTQAANTQWAEASAIIKFVRAPWDQVHKNNAISAVIAVGDELRREGETSAEAFLRVYGEMRFVWGPNDVQSEVELHGWSPCHNDAGEVVICHGGWSEPSTTDVVAFYTPGYTGFQFETLVIHELGHKLNYHYRTTVASVSSADETIILTGGVAPNGVWRHTSVPGSSTEMFADMFTAWVYGGWNSWPNDPRNQAIVDNAILAMNIAMSEFTR